MVLVHIWISRRFEYHQICVYYSNTQSQCLSSHFFSRTNCGCLGFPKWSNYCYILYDPLTIWSNLFFERKFHSSGIYFSSIIKRYPLLNIIVLSSSVSGSATFTSECRASFTPKRWNFQTDAVVAGNVIMVLFVYSLIRIIYTAGWERTAPKTPVWKGAFHNLWPDDASISSEEFDE